MEQLPPELLLYILSYLPIRNIHTVQAVSTSFNTLIKENVNQVYRSAASLHQLAGGQALPQGDPISALKHITRHYFSTWMDGVEDWKSFCKKVYIEEALWHGKKLRNVLLYPRVKTLETFDRGVHRFKVDTEEKTIISTGRMGGLIVSSVDTQEVLWSLPASYVREGAHLEYSNGFFVFKRSGEHMEVWRRSTDSMNPVTYLPSNPTASQIQACPGIPPDLFVFHRQSNLSNSSTNSSEDHRFSSTIHPPLPLPRRGAYLPFTILENPHPITAFRFVYPYLLLGSPTMKQAFIWDVPQAKLLEIVNIPPPQQYSDDEGNIQNINYVDISDKHIFVCWTAGLRVYRWKAKGLNQAVGDVVFTYPPMERRDGLKFLYKVWDQRPMWDANYCSVSGSVRLLFQPQDAKWTKAEELKCIPSAFHVSPDGKDLVVLINKAHLLYVPNFIKVPHKLATKKPTKRYEIERKQLEVPNLFMVESDSNCSYLAFDGKRAVVSAGFGCFVLNFHDRRNVPTYNYPEKIKGREIIVPRMIRVQFTGDGEYRAFVPSSCLQITESAIWMTRAWVQGLPLQVKVFDMSDLKLLL